MNTFRIYLISSVLLSFSFRANAQDTIFRYTYGGSSYDHGRSVQQTTDGGYIIAGSTSSGGAGSSDVYLIKIDSLGNFLWSKTYGGTDSDNGVRIISVSGGNYLLAAKTKSWGPGIPTYSNNLLVKVDASGNVLWAKVYGTTTRQIAVDVIEDINGDYIAGAWNAPGDDPLVFKVNGTNGNLIWDELVMDNTGDNQIEEVIPTPSGQGCIIVGSSNGTGGNMWDPYIAEIDGNGTLVWAKYINGNTGSRPVEQTKKAIRTVSGGYANVGIEETVGGAGQYSGLIVVYKSNGDFSWARAFDTPGSGADESAYDVTQDEDENFYITGKSTVGGGGKNLFVVKYDKSGNYQWTRYYGGSGSDVGNVIKYLNGALLIGGVVGSPSYGATSSDMRSEERRVGKECRSRLSPYH